MPTLGLISDTHLPDRLAALPPAVFDLLSGVDLILHAGDIGTLDVLDQLSAIAPVVAVHGNDETEEATAALPYLQTVVVAGHRLVLTHAHYPHRDDELANRGEDWQPHLRRRAGFARQHGATLIIYGHLHIPMSLQHEGVWLINPGALASGNPWTHQTIQTVARLTLEPNQTPSLTHLNLATGQPHTPVFDPKGFSATAQAYQAPIMAPELYAERDWLWNTLRPSDPAVHAALLAPAHRRWARTRADLISPSELVADLRAANLPPATLALLGGHPLFARHFGQSA